MTLVAVTAATLTSFTSCTEDSDIARVLSGCWEGDFSMYFVYEDRYGELIEVEAEYTDLEFVPSANSSTRGIGYQTDYYDYGPYDEVYHSFSWEVRGGNIYLDYRHGDDEDLTTFLRDYHLTNDRLTGYFGNTTSSFYLRKYENYYDWTPFIDYYGDYNTGRGYGYHENRDWARTRALEVASDTTSLKVVHYGCRHSEH